MVVFRCGESILDFFSNKTLYKKFYKTLSPQQKTTTLVQILFRAAHTYSKDSKKKVSGKLVKKSGRPSHYITFILPAAEIVTRKFFEELEK